MHHCYHIAESNYDYTFPIEIYAIVFMMLNNILLLLLKELRLAFFVRQMGC